MKVKEGMTDEKVVDIDKTSAVLDPRRIENNVTYILDHFGQKTKRNERYYSFRRVTNVQELAKDRSVKEDRSSTRLNGFNSILAVSSIEAAKMYYLEFQKQMAGRPDKAIRIATIYSYGQNEDDPNGFISDENSDSTSGLDIPSRDFLEMAIEDYNRMFGTAYDTSSTKFPNYYKDLSLRMKNCEVDLLIVVNMFLTGFDATTLNTLWVDKNLKQHGLIQAFSRTNRILNSVKTFGNIVTFRNLQAETDAAIALFGDKDATGIVLLKSYNDYYYGYTDDKGHYQKGYKEQIEELVKEYPLGQIIVGESAEKKFISTYSSILRLKNILSSFDDFKDQQILPPIDFQDYTGIYNDLYYKYRTRTKGENIEDDIIFETELVKQVEVNIDYILNLIAKYHKDNCKDKELLVAVDRAIKSSLELRSKKELIEGFISSLNVDTDVYKDWPLYVQEQKEKDLQAIIEDEKLKADETKRLVADSLRDGEIRTDGTAISSILPPVSRFGGSNRTKKKETVIEKLKGFFDKYFGI